MELPVAKKVVMYTTHPSTKQDKIKYHPITSGQHLEILTLKGFYQEAFQKGELTVADEIEFYKKLKDIIMPSFPTLQSEDYTQGDLIWFLLELRRNSISPSIPLSLRCPKCKQMNGKNLDISELELNDVWTTKKFTLTNDPSITLTFGRMSLDELFNDTKADTELNTIVGSLKEIKGSTGPINAANIPPKDLLSWFNDNVSGTDLETIVTFFSNEPGIENISLKVEKCMNWMTTEKISKEKTVPLFISELTYRNNFGKTSDEYHIYLDTEDYYRCGESYSVVVDEFISFFI